MTITLTFNPEIEASLIAKAQSKGMELPEYLQSLVEQEFLSSGPLTAPTEATRRENAVRRMLEFGDKYGLSLGEPIARGALHEGHRF